MLPSHTPLMESMRATRAIGLLYRSQHLGTPLPGPGDRHAPTIDGQVQTTRNEAPQYARVGLTQQLQGPAQLGGTGPGCIRGILGCPSATAVCSTGTAGCCRAQLRKTRKAVAGHHGGGVRGTLGLHCRRLQISSGELVAGNSKGPRLFVDIVHVCQPTGAKHRSRAAGVHARCWWWRAANNTAHSETAYTGSSHGHTDRGAWKQGRLSRHQRVKQTRRARLLAPFAPPTMMDPAPLAKVTPVMRASGATWSPRRGNLATDV
jgi:hypothetical protein